MNKITENKDQRALRLWISAGLQITEVVELHGDAKYLLNNMIAKYTLAASEYKLSENALFKMNESNVDLTQTYKRRKFYGRTSSFIYEHCVPVGIVRAKLIACDKTEETVFEILQKSGFVAVLLREENQLLRSKKLNSRMPANWQYGDQVKARYDEVGIKISESSLLVEGAIMR